MYEQLAKKTDVPIDYTYGYKRAEVLGAFANGMIIVSLSFTIVLDSIQRFVTPTGNIVYCRPWNPENAKLMPFLKTVVKNPLLVLIVAGGSLVFNILGMFLFSGGKQNINSK